MKTMNKNNATHTAKGEAKTKKISKAGLFMRSLPKGEILDMRAVLK